MVLCAFYFGGAARYLDVSNWQQGLDMALQDPRQLRMLRWMAEGVPLSDLINWVALVETPEPETLTSHPGLV